MNFGEYVKASRSGVSLYKILFGFIVDEFVVKHAFYIFSNPFLYSVSLVVILLFVEGGIISCRLYSSMYQDLSIITVADPLSADLMSCLYLS